MLLRLWGTFDSLVQVSLKGASKCLAQDARVCVDVRAFLVRAEVE